MSCNQAPPPSGPHHPGSSERRLTLCKDRSTVDVGGCASIQRIVQSDLIGSAVTIAVRVFEAGPSGGVSLTMDFDTIVQLRMIERLGLSGLIVVITVLVMIIYARTAQQVRLRSEDVGLGATVVLSTPVLLLFALIGYAWVTLNAPVLSRVAPLDTMAPLPETAQQASSGAVRDFLGAAPVSETGEVVLPPVTEADARRLVGAVNCLIQDADLTVRARNDLVDLKLRILATVWDETRFGEFAQLENWAHQRSAELPPDPAIEAFEVALLRCRTG